MQNLKVLNDNVCQFQQQFDDLFENEEIEDVKMEDQQNENAPPTNWIQLFHSVISYIPYIPVSTSWCVRNPIVSSFAIVSISEDPFFNVLFTRLTPLDSQPNLSRTEMPFS